MLYLRTGANGSCKTLFTLKDVRKLQLETGREVYFVKDRFKARPILTEEFGWVPIEFKEWLDLPDNAIILADECHKDLPKRAPSAPVPPHVQQLAEHRARGFDFFLLTQHPMNIDDFVRRLVGAPGYHQHFKRVFGGTNATKVLEFDAVNPQCEKDGSGRNAQVSTRTQPKEVYDWYESATLHTAKVRVPKQLWTLLFCLVAIVAMVYFAVQQLMPKKSASEKPGTAETVQTNSSPSSGGGGQERKPMTVAEYVAAYQPRVAGLMHSAPAYDKLTEPKRVPVPAACLYMASKGCRCFTQDATPYPAPDDVCKGMVDHGAFLAFQPEGELRQQQPAPQSVKAQGPAEATAQGSGGLILIGEPPAAPAPPPAPAAPPVPQRIASVKRP